MVCGYFESTKMFFIIIRASLPKNILKECIPNEDASIMLSTELHTSVWVCLPPFPTSTYNTMSIFVCSVYSYKSIVQVQTELELFVDTAS